MAYSILLVDDEMPALRFIQSLTEKYAPDFTISHMCSTGEAALELLQQHSYDVLITDITMQKMNGIELAMKARSLQPGIHIIIISGYADFEYAQGAIQASVDDYILKPVGISRFRQVMEKLKNALTEDHAALSSAVLPALACGLPYDAKALRQWSGSTYFFALIRWGGVDHRRSQTLRGTSLVRQAPEGLFVLHGRDENEHILIAPDSGLENFLSDISMYMSQRFGFSTWTVIYRADSRPITALYDFLVQAFPLLHQSSILGRHQILSTSAASVISNKKSEVELSIFESNQLQFYSSTGKNDMIKVIFLDLASTLDKKAAPQFNVYLLVEQLLIQLAGSTPYIRTNYDTIKAAVTDLFINSSSYTALMTDIYSVIYENEDSIRNHKMSTRELFDYALRYIDKNYAKQLSVQSVCDELSISPTYLSRLFRKYGNTTFNTYLMQKRMDAAIELLTKKPDMLLRDISYCVGYEDPSYFAKVFSRYTGKKPSQYINND